MKISGSSSSAPNSLNPTPAPKLSKGTFAPKSAIKNALKTAQIDPSLKAELSSLAHEVKLGNIPSQKASREFVGVMVKQYFENKICAKSQKVIEDALCEVLDGDANFGARLEKNLKVMTGTT